jgi:hypothetical protein
VNNLLQQAYDFLVVNDFPTLMELIRNLEWGVVLKSGYTWLILFPILAAIVWSKRFKFLVALASLVIFVMVLQYTLPPPDKKIMLEDLLVFLGGTFALLSANIYFIFIRD